MSNSNVPEQTVTELEPCCRRFNARWLDVCFVLAVLVLSGLYFLLQDYRSIILNAYFIPVAASTLLLGWLRASGLSLLGFCLVLTISWVDWRSGGVGLVEFLTLVAWGCTLGTICGMIGLCLKNKEKSFASLLEREATNALTDPLTGIMNRRAFDRELHRQLALLDRSQISFAVLMVDIDRFKRINDRFGHAVGDRVLKDVAGCILESLRDADLAARFGGEEFAVILGNTNLKQAQIVAERIRTNVERLRPSRHGTTIQLTVSVGVALANANEPEVALLKRADLALYAAKQDGRNLVRVDSYRPADCESNKVSESLGFYERAQASEGSLDDVLGLPLARYFLDELRRRVSEVNRYETLLSLSLVEIEDFDVLAAKGDACVENALCFVADYVRRGLRDCDVVTWIAKNQFAILLPHTLRDDALIPVTRILADLEVAERPKFRGEELDIRLAARICDVQYGDNVAALLESVSQAEPISVDTAVLESENQVF